MLIFFLSVANVFTKSMYLPSFEDGYKNVFIMLFTFAAIRAVHVEVTGGMSTKISINAL